MTPTLFTIAASLQSPADLPTLEPPATQPASPAHVEHSPVHPRAIGGCGAPSSRVWIASPTYSARVVEPRFISTIRTIPGNESSVIRAYRPADGGFDHGILHGDGRFVPYPNGNDAPDPGAAGD